MGKQLAEPKVCPGCGYRWSFEVRTSWWLTQDTCWGCDGSPQQRRESGNEEARRGS